VNEPVPVFTVLRCAWHDFVVARRELFVYEVLFKLVEAWLLVPVLALVLAVVLSRAGYVAVTNRDILAFLLTPFGLVYAVLSGTITVAVVLLELAGIMVVVEPGGRARRPAVKQVLRALGSKVWRVIQLSALVLVLLAGILLPFVLLAVLTYRILLTEHDIYFYWTVRPLVFWVAAGIGGLLVVGALAVGACACVRWSLALPIALFEDRSAWSALRASRERVRGAGWRVGLILGGWILGVLVVGAGLEVVFRLAAAATLDNAGERPVVLILILLLAHAGLLATISFVLIVGLGLAARRLYLHRDGQRALVRSEGLETAPGEGEPGGRWSVWLSALSVLTLLVAPVVLWVNLSRYVSARPPVQVTAHRGHARLAPENTLSAVRKAIASGADFAEIDVQMTADDVVVLLHDSDLQRVAGIPRRIADIRYDELRAIDVGSWFDRSFAGERVPTLVEVMNAARGKIKLNIELKFYGPGRRLAKEVARLIREQDLAAECLVTSMNYDALEVVRQHCPEVRTGLIVAHALGDVSRLEVEVLSVRADWLSDEVLRAAHRRGQEVHVWTVNDAGQMIRLIKRGVDNILTSDPDLAIRVRDEWAGLTGSERLLLASRLLLGLEP
jgi:glycerophosphoryl diester phosphodiesterase